MQVGHIVKAALEPLCIGDLVSLVRQEHGQTLTKVGLEPDKFLLEVVHKALVLPVVARHMSIVHVHGLSLIVLEFLS